MTADGCICGPVDVIGPSGDREDGPNGGGPDEDCPVHGITASHHQPYDVPLFPVEDPAPATLLGVADTDGSEIAHGSES